MITRTVSLNNVNLRPGPGKRFPPIRQMAAGTTVQLFDGLTRDADTYTWQAILLADFTVGWCVTVYDGQPVLVAPQAPRHSQYGVHVLPGGHSNDTGGMAQRLDAAGHRMGGALVGGIPELANILVPLVDRVFYRIMNVPPYEVDYDPDPARAYEQGRQWVRDRQGDLGLVNPYAYIVYQNESKWKPTESDFMRGLLDENNGRRKLGLYADGVGNPDDENGTTAEQKWLTRLPILRRAKQEGHVYLSHLYSAPGTAPGLLSPLDKRHFYETRYRRFKPITPVDCQLPWVVSEAGREYINGTYDGVAPTVAWMKAIVLELGLDVEAVCAYTAGVWKSSSIDDALPALETLYRGSL